MASILVEESDEYDSDSLNCDNDVVLDFDEIPESPKVDIEKLVADNSNELDSQVCVNSCSMLSTNKSLKDITASSSISKREGSSIESLQFASKIFTVSSLSDNTLPEVFVNKTDDDKILDYRSIVKTKLRTSKHSFANMKFKDFKEAKKNLQCGINSKLGHSVDINRRSKNVKNQIDSNILKEGIVNNSKKNQSNISKKMNKLRDTIQILSHHISKLETKKTDFKKEQFLTPRKSVCIKNDDVIIDDTICFDAPADDNENYLSDLVKQEIPDSLENSENEIELDDQFAIRNDNQDVVVENFFKKRATISSKFTEIIVNQSINEEDCDKKDFDHDSLESKSIASSEASSVSDTDKNLSKDVRKSESDNEEIELKLYKRKRTNSNRIAKDDEFNVDNGQNIPQYPVRSKKDRKYLIGFMCKDCQDYFATRDVSKEQLKKLIQACSRHRGHNIPQRTINSFWQTDFPPSPESSNDNNRLVVEESQLRPKTSNLQNILDENYSEWEANIDMNSRESNVLYSTKLN